MGLDDLTKKIIMHMDGREVGVKCMRRQIDARCTMRDTVSIDMMHDIAYKTMYFVKKMHDAPS